MLEGFEFCAPATEEMIQKYTGSVPDGLVEIWRSQGLGTILNGYLRFINPDDYDELLKSSYFEGNVSVPIMTTAFGDIITWKKGRYVGIVKYRNGTFDTMFPDFNMFLKLTNDSGFQKEFFDLKMYEKAVAKYGRLALDQCFGFVPLLALGGKKSVESLRIVKTREHIALITEMVGTI